MATDHSFADYSIPHLASLPGRLVLSHLNNIKNCIQITDQQEDRADVAPAEPPEESGSVSQHALDVRGEPVHTVNPADSGRLHKHHKQDSQAWPVHVQ